MVKFFGKQLRFPHFGFNLTNSKFFRTAVEKSFSDVDLDCDARLDYKELYIGLLRLYDILNSKLPCHVKPPKLDDINRLMRKFDIDESGKVELPEYMALCKSLVGTRRDWRESLALKIAVTVFAKAIAFPALGGALKAGLLAAGVTKAEKVPTGALTFAVEMCTKQIAPM